MRILLAFVAIASASHMRVDLGTLAIASRTPVKLSLPSPTFSETGTATAKFDCDPPTVANLLFNGRLRCGSAISLSLSRMHTFLSQLTVELPKHSPESIEVKVTIEAINGESLARYKFRVQSTRQIPVTRLIRQLDPRINVETPVLKLDAAWPETQNPYVAVEGGAGLVSGAVKEGKVFLKLNAPVDEMAVRVRLFDRQSGIASLTFPFEIGRASPLVNKKYAAALSLLLALSAVGAAALAIARQQQRQTPKTMAIAEWNESVMQRSCTTGKTCDDSFSTIVSDFDDAQLVRVGNRGVQLSPCVEVVELPIDMRLSL